MKVRLVLLSLGALLALHASADSIVVLKQTEPHGKSAFAFSFLPDKTASLSLQNSTMTLQIQTRDGIRKIAGPAVKQKTKDDSVCYALYSMIVRTGSEILYIQFEEHPQHPPCNEEYPEGSLVTITSFDVNARGTPLAMGFVQLTEVRQ